MFRKLTILKFSEVRVRNHQVEKVSSDKFWREVQYAAFKKQLIAPWAQSLVPETCRGAALSVRLGEDSVRRAKADFPLVPLCPVKSMAPVLAIAGMVEGQSIQRPFDPVGEIF